MSTGRQRRSVFTGKTEQPCCLCGASDTGIRLDLPPRAVPEMRNADPIAWRDIVGEVSIHFCGSDWELVRDLVLDVGTSPLGRCNVARASFDLRQEFEALVDAVREEPDHAPLERRMLEDARETLGTAEREGRDAVPDRDLVEASVVRWVLADRVDAATPGG